MFFYYIDLAWRSFKRTPFVSMLMVLAIAVGIGITMTSLSVYYMMAMNPIPDKSDRLHVVQLNTMDEGQSQGSSDNLPQQLTYRDAMALYQQDFPENKVIHMRSGFAVHLGDSSIKPFLEATRMAGRDFFSMFNLEFQYGGAWSVEQEQNAAQVAVISQSLNEKLFGSENSLGKTFYLDDKVFQVVGVLDEWNLHTRFYDITTGAFSRTENIFIPFSLVPVLEVPSWGNTNGWKYQEINNYQDRLNAEIFWVQLWVELPNEQAKAQYGQFLQAYLSEQEALGRFERETPQYALRNVMEWLDYSNVVSDDNRVLVGLSFMFLIVCLANILGLLLGKFLKRAPEIGVRRALGARKRQVFAQHIVEVSLLGLFGGLLGIGIAQLGLWGVRATENYYSALATMDLSMLLAAPSISIIACIIAGLYPAWLVCKTAPAIYLKTQ
uniref:ABC transporter permease n=1 Tax=Ningiella ruwaisensis TaxID=2364274 RepID=UPI00109EE72A|nr:ABC transporter permease [Ningiella ruwaisensis]